MDVASPPLASGFALAKIQPPRPRAGLVERPALEAALAEALATRRLTLLVAPAGYGKTAALSRQLMKLPTGCALAWVSADEDDHLPRFLACLTAALEPHDLPWRVDPGSLATLAMAERGLRDAASEIVNALARSEASHGLIAIDDAHRISDPRVFQLLQHMLERLPAPWGVAIAGRVEPPLPLARWRGAAELVDFRQHDLRFRESEVDALLRSVGGALESAPSARDLLARTDGWAAGLRLSISAPRGGATRHPASATQRHLFDYLADEVLADMPSALRDFLVRCSVLPELTAARCATVSGIAEARMLLEETERRGLFVSVLDADELTLKLHDLFRDFLEDRLRRDHPDELGGLLRRAAASEPDLARAIGYWGQAGDWDAAAARLIEDARGLIAAGGVRIGEMLAMLPPAPFDRYPDLHMLRGIGAFFEFDFEVTVEAMGRAAAGYRQQRKPGWAASARAYAALAMQSTGKLDESEREYERLLTLPLDPPVLAFVRFGMAWQRYARADGAGVAPLFERMLDALDTVAEFEVWNLVFFHSLMTGLPGMAPLIERFARGAERVGGTSPSPLRAGVLHARVLAGLDRGSLAAAVAALAEADEVAHWIGRPRSIRTENQMAHALVDALRGDPAASLAAIDECLDDLRRAPSPGNRRVHEYEMVFTRVRVAWLAADTARLRADVATLEAIADPIEWTVAAAHRRFARAFLALVDGRLEEARPLLASVSAPIESTCFFPATQATLLLADCELRLGDLDAAATTLATWLPDAHDGTRLAGALLAGGAVLDRLAQADWAGRLEAADVALIQ